MARNIFELLEYGPIVLCDEDLGLVWTINGSYLNIWVLRGDEFEGTDCRSGHPDLDNLTVSQARQLAELWRGNIYQELEREGA